MEDIKNLEFSLNNIFNTQNEEFMEEVDQTLGELQKAISRFIKTGYKTEQLDNFLQDKEKFYKKYNNRLYLKEINKKLKKDINKYMLIEEAECTKCIKNNLEDEMMQTINNIASVVSYASGINLLYEFYNNEKVIRNEQEKFKKISKEVNHKTIVNIEELKETNMKLDSPDIIYDIIEKYWEFFNIRHAKDHIQISLKQKGKRLDEYNTNNKQYSGEEVSDLIIDTCKKVLKMMTISDYNNIKIEGLSINKERWIKDTIEDFKHNLMVETYDYSSEKVLCMSYIEKNEIYSIKEEEEKDEIFRFRL